MSAVGFGCAGDSNLTICQPRGNRYRTVRYCYTCKRRRRSLVTEFVWYDPEVECCTCFGTGAEWLAERGTRRTALAWIAAEIDATFGGEAASASVR